MISIHNTKLLKKGDPIGMRFLFPAFFYLLVITIFPFIFFIISSFQYYYLPKVEMKHFIGLKNYITVLNDPVLGTSIIQTLKHICITIGIEISLGLFIAILLNSDFVYFKRVWRSLLIIPMMITPTIASFFLYYLFNENYGLINHLIELLGIKGLPWLSDPKFALLVICIVEIWMWTPFVALMILAGLQSLSEDIYEAAILEGASNFQLWRYITLPLIKDTLIVVLIIKFIWTLKVFDSVAIITKGGPGHATYLISFLIYKRGFEFFKLGEASAMAVMFLIVVGISARFIFNRISIQQVG